MRGGRGRRSTRHKTQGTGALDCFAALAMTNRVRKCEKWERKPKQVLTNEHTRYKIRKNEK
jgi:hypothetical protein